MNKNDRIAVIGAGPGGLSAAWYLKKKGFKRVTVLEKQGRVGGLARSITEGYRPYDLGANLTTLSYRSVSRVAKEINAKRFSESTYTALKVSENEASFVPLMEAVLQGGSLFKFAKALGVYVRERWKISKEIDQVSWQGIGQNEALMCSFGTWLDRHGMQVLRPFFQIPITTFGYGYLDEIPAIYALKYMDLRTVVPSALAGASPIFKWIFPYPKKFEHGFQRYFEAMSWRLNVRLNIRIKKIERLTSGKIKITLIQQRQIMNEIKESEQVELFDHIVIATPFTEDVLAPMMDLTPTENELIKEVVTYGYSMTTMHVENLKLPTPISIVTPLTELGSPWAIVKQWDENNFTQFYTRVVDPYDKNNYQKVRSSVEGLIEKMNGNIVDDMAEWSTYDQWPYFQHLKVSSIEKNWFDRFEKMQGNHNTWYVGAIASFELIEPIFNYSRFIANRMENA